MTQSPLHRKFFILLLTLISIAFLAILLPFFGAVFWAAILALLFAPLNRWLLRSVAEAPQRLAALVDAEPDPAAGDPADDPDRRRAGRPGGRRSTSGSSPASSTSATISGTGRRRCCRNGCAAQLEQLRAARPGRDSRSASATARARSASTSRARRSTSARTTLHFVVSFGIMLYLLFFLLRDGPWLSRAISRAIPLASEQKRRCSTSSRR